MANLEKFGQTYTDTAPEKLAGLSDEALDSCYRYFLDIYPELTGREGMSRSAQNRIGLLRSEIDLRHGKAQHKEALGVSQNTLDVGKQTLNWARVGGIAGIAAVLITAVALLAQIYFSKVQSSKPATTSPVSLPQTTATISESPEPEATASSATPLPKPAATAMPSITP